MSFQNILNNNIQQCLTPICLINNVIIFILLSFKPKKKSIFCNQILFCTLESLSKLSFTFVQRTGQNSHFGQNAHPYGEQRIFV